MDKEDMIEAGIITEEPTEEAVEETAPQEETGAENPETEAAGEESGAPSAEDSHTAEENSQTVENAPAPFALGVQYGGETRSLNEQEATDYAEKGMEYEAITPMLDKLRMLAAGCGKERSFRNAAVAVYSVGNKLGANDIPEISQGSERSSVGTNVQYIRR